MSPLKKTTLAFWGTLCLLVPARTMLLEQGVLNEASATPLNYLGLLPHWQHRWGMFEKLPAVYRIPILADADGNRRIADDIVNTPSLGYKRSRIAILATLDLDYIRQLCLWSQRQQGSLGVMLYSQPLGVTYDTSGNSDWPYYSQQTWIEGACE